MCSRNARDVTHKKSKLFWYSDCFPFRISRWSLFSWLVLFSVTLSTTIINRANQCSLSQFTSLSDYSFIITMKLKGLQLLCFEELRENLLFRQPSKMWIPLIIMQLKWQPLYREARKNVLVTAGRDSWEGYMQNFVACFLSTRVHLTHIHIINKIKITKLKKPFDENSWKVFRKWDNT